MTITSYETNEEIKELWSLFPFPDFLKKYLIVTSIKRLKYISYYCGMDYASSYYYQFKYFVSRYDHSLTCALLTYYLTNDKTKTITALLHDISTPCFSHVIDYMNKDYKKQETTEAKTLEIIKNDRLLNSFLNEDNINIDDIMNNLKNSVVDNKRPKLCVDRIDGIVTPSLTWLKNIDITLAKHIFNDLCVITNECGEEELSFHSLKMIFHIDRLNQALNVATHSKYDVYLMNLLANITSYLISQKYITYDDLYVLNEKVLCDMINNRSINDLELQKLWIEFQNTHVIPKKEYPQVKKRELQLYYNKTRF